MKNGSSPPHVSARVAWCVALLCAAVMAACNGGGGAVFGPQASSGPAPTPSSPNGAQADTSILFFGNSHTSINDVPATVAAMLRAGAPGRTVATVTSPDWMLLNARGDHEPSLALLRSQRWSVVVLQAQDYSSSGQFIYPTTGAEKLVQLSRAQGALPVLFAEWPRFGIDESARIVSVYGSVAERAPSCLPPIPEAFDLAKQRHPDLGLHAADGNHSSPAGAYLASLLLYASISRQAPAALPDIAVREVDAATQARLRAVARDTMARVSARRGCPGD
jgi:hypothetical protein